MFRRTFAEIDLDALESNLRGLEAHFAPGTFLCPMVKANAYGHGDVTVALALEAMGVRQVGVCLIEEGLLLREAGVKTGILVFRGFDRDGAREILRAEMTPVVSSWDQIGHLEAIAKAPVAIHLKFNTGMNRLGFPVQDASALFARLSGNPKIRVEALLTHLSQGEDADRTDGVSAGQLTSLQQAAEVFRPMKPVLHALNSAGIIRKIDGASPSSPSLGHPLRAANWGLRPGLMLYGTNPIAPDLGLKLAPVMTLRSHVGTYRHLAPGEPVSYGGTWRAPKDSVVAVVPIGYADGYHRLLSNRAQALFAGERVPVVGTVCMDYLMLDVTDVVRRRNLPVDVDQEVVLFGRSETGAELPAAELATHAETIPWEIMTSVGERVPRRYVGQLAVSGRIAAGGSS